MSVVYGYRVVVRCDFEFGVKVVSQFLWFLGCSQLGYFDGILTVFQEGRVISLGLSVFQG